MLVLVLWCRRGSCVGVGVGDSVAVGVGVRKGWNGCWQRWLGLGEERTSAAVGVVVCVAVVGVV